MFHLGCQNMSYSGENFYLKLLCVVGKRRLKVSAKFCREDDKTVKQFVKLCEFIHRENRCLTNS